MWWSLTSSSTVDGREAELDPAPEGKSDGLLKKRQGLTASEGVVLEEEVKRGPGTPVCG